MKEQRDKLRFSEGRVEKTERTGELMALREGERREEKFRIDGSRYENRDKRRTLELRVGRMDYRGRVWELRSEERDDRHRTIPRRNLRELSNKWGIDRREDRHERESKVYTGHKRERLDEIMREHRTEKRHRSDDERDDRGRYHAVSDFVERRREKYSEKHREDFRERFRPRLDERPSSISDLNRIHGRLLVDREGLETQSYSSEVFECMENVNGRRINILGGLKLHTNVFDPLEQTKITDFVYAMQKLGQEGQLRKHTYTAPAKWMRGKGRITLQFGCCYNYAKDNRGNLPGIMRDVNVDPIPPLLKDMIRRLVNWDILPKTCVPDSCIINIYDKGDCIPPHIDHHDFLRPFCTVSFLSDAGILFGRNLRVAGPGDFMGSTSITLLCGSVLVLSGNGADVAKHCVPAVNAKRISITFRKMVHEKQPYQHKPDPDLNFV